jgi:membrane protein
MFAAFQIPLSWGELVKRTAKESNEDDVLGLAAQLAYYFFLALFPAALFLLALASFFPLTNVIDDVIRLIGPFVAPDVLRFLEQQLRLLSNADSGGILTLGIAGAIWSSSAAIVAITGSLNRAYDITESRPWWKVRLTAIGLTVGLALLGLTAFTLIVAGPTIAERLAASMGLGAAFEWTWNILQWPVIFALMATAVGLVYYFAPDAEQEWVWITPGAVVGTLLWIVASLVFKFYVSHFTDYNASYGAVGGVIVLLLWFYISGLSILVGAEMNAEIEHASPYGKDPGEKVVGARKKIGRAAWRAFQARQSRQDAHGSQEPVSPLPRTAALQVAREVPMAPSSDERTLGEMFGDLTRDTRTLVQQELQLAKTELAEKASTMTRSAGVIAGGGFVAYAGMLAIIAGLVLLLVAAGLPPWAAALLGGVLLVIVGYFLIRSGMAALKPQNLTPHKTIVSLKEDAQWLKAQTK